MSSQKIHNYILEFTKNSQSVINMLYISLLQNS